MKRYWYVRLELSRSTGKRNADVPFSLVAPQPPEDFIYSDSAVFVQVFWFDNERVANLVAEGYAEREGAERANYRKYAG
jgi:hypothetical protein